MIIKKSQPLKLIGSTRRCGEPSLIFFVKKGKEKKDEESNDFTADERQDKGTD